MGLRLDVNPRDPNGDRYRAVSRARAAKSSVHARVIVTMDVRCSIGRSIGRSNGRSDHCSDAELLDPVEMR